MSKCKTISPEKSDSPFDADVLKSTGMSKHFRRLKWNEVVSRGDFIVNKKHELEPWSGPGGFRADTFVNPICRPLTRRPANRKKTS